LSEHQYNSFSAPFIEQPGTRQQEKRLALKKFLLPFKSLKALPIEQVFQKKNMFYKK